MVGKNTLHLNHATMLEAVQLWLNASFKEPTPKATLINVTKDASSKYNATNDTDFVIEIQTVEPVPEPAKS